MKDVKQCFGYCLSIKCSNELLSPAENVVWVGRMKPLLNYLKIADPGSAPVPEGEK